MKEYLVWGETGPAAGDCVEEIRKATSPENARQNFIRKMKKRPVWEYMGEHNVHVREYVATKERKEVEEYLTNDFNVEGSIGEVILTLRAYQADILARGGIQGSGRIECEDYGYDGAYDIVIKYRRYENDEEFAARTRLEDMVRQNNESAKAKKEAQERKEYRRLKRKFEGK
jgi:hypothetical protein